MPPSAAGPDTLKILRVLFPTLAPGMLSSIPTRAKAFPGLAELRATKAVLEQGRLYLEVSHQWVSMEVSKPMSAGLAKSRGGDG